MSDTNSKDEEVFVLVDEASKALAVQEKIQKIGGIIFAGVIAAGIGVAAVSDWWMRVLEGGGLMLLPVGFTLPFFLVIAALIGFLARHFGIKRSDRFYDKKVLEIFTGSRSLLIEVLQGSDSRCTLRILNMSPQRWYIHEVYWGTYSLDKDSVTEPPKCNGALERMLHPYARWKQEYTLPAKCTALRLNKGSIVVSVSPVGIEQYPEKVSCDASVVYFPRTEN